LDASNLGSGTVPDDRFPSTLPAISGTNLTSLTGASAGTYGDASNVSQIVVDSNGRITGISNVSISGGDTVSITTTAADILSVSSGAISADDAGADKIVFWDDSEGKLTYLTVGTNLTVTDTTISASGGGGSASDSFKTISVSGQSDVVADSSTDTLTLVAGSNMTITTDASGDSITLSSSGGGGGGGGSIGIQSGGTQITSSASTINFVGTGITMSDDGSTTDIHIPVSTRTTTRTVATNAQTTFSATYTVGYVDVYLNGSKLDSTEFTATNGTSVVLGTGASTDDIIETVAQNITASVDLNGLANLVDDTTPQLGGDLDLNNNDITGTGDINITGDVTATSFSGSGSALTGLTGASAATYGSANATPIIVVDSNGKITGISTVATSGSGGGGGVSKGKAYAFAAVFG